MVVHMAHCERHTLPMLKLSARHKNSQNTTGSNTLGNTTFETNMLYIPLLLLLLPLPPLMSLLSLP